MINWRALLPMLTLFAAPALGQTLAQHNAVDAACPTPADLANVLPRREASLGTIVLGYTFVLRDSARRDAEAQNWIRTNSSVAAPQMPQHVPRPALFERVDLLGQANSPGPDHRLLIRWSANRGTPACGWVARHDLLGVPDVRLSPGSNTQMAIGPRPQTSKQLSLDDSDLITRVVLNTTQADAGTEIIAYRDPNRAPRGRQGAAPPADTVATRLRLHEFFTVFAREDVPGTDGGPTTTFFLVGLAGSRSESARIDGWVNRDDLYFWNSRAAVYWLPGVNARVFDQEDSAGFPSGPSIPPRVPPESPDRNTHRYAVISSSPTPSQILRQLPETGTWPDPLQLSRMVRSYRVAIPWRVDGVGTRDSGGRPLRDPQDVIESLRRIDVIFLVDATSSMDPYFAPTARAVREFVRGLRGDPRASDFSVRISVSTYRDYLRETADIANVQFETVVRPFLVSSGVREDELARLENLRIPPLNDPFGDKLEAPFAAIIRAASEAGWRDEAGLRMIVHVADHGNRDFGQPSPFGRRVTIEGRSVAPIVERISLDQVVTALRPAGQPPVLYFPIQVEGDRGTTAEDNQARNAFQTQARLLLERLWPGRPEMTSVFLSTAPNPNQRETPAVRQEVVRQALLRALEFNRAVSDRRDQIERCVRTPDAEECRRQQIAGSVTGGDGTAMASVSFQAGALMEAILPREEIEAADRRGLNVRSWFVRPVEESGGRPVQALSYWVAFDRDGLANVQAAMTRFCDFLAPPRRGERGESDIQEQFDQLLERLARSLQTAPADLINRRREAIGLLAQIPFWERQQVLATPLEVLLELVGRGANPDPSISSPARATIQRLRNSFCTSASLLSLVEQRRRPTVPIDRLELLETGQLRTDRLGEWQEFDWEIRAARGRGERIIFVPFDYLPIDNPPRMVGQR